MKRLFLILVMITSGYFGVTAQTIRSGIGGNVGNNILFGESRIADSKLSPNLGIYGIYKISNKLSAKFQIGFGQFNGNLTTSEYSTSFVPAELLCIYSFPTIFKLNPFLHLGAGGFGFKLEDSGPFTDAMAIGGGGFEIILNSKFSWLVSADFRYTTGDDFNHITGGLNDAYVSIQTGITYTLKKSEEEFDQKEKAMKSTILAQLELDEERLLLRTRIADLKNDLVKRDDEIEYIKLLLRTHKKNVEQLAFQVADYIQKSKKK